MPYPKGDLVGDEIREMRQELGLSQLEVAEAWGRPQPNLSEIENNVRRMSEKHKRLLIATMKHLAKEKGAQ